MLETLNEEEFVPLCVRCQAVPKSANDPELCSTCIVAVKVETHQGIEKLKKYMKDGK